ncbi:PPC domain-containing protein [Corallococcus coralloides]|uniref:PPC domain-containing protein n=1 Tax=Corallococcus coralloides TaxID=184914 RepID=UPI0011D23CD8|nr:PPC domain-containing protein [Corallococcus coralloides]
MKSLAAVWLTCALTGCGAEMETPTGALEEGAIEVPVGENAEQAPVVEKGPPPERRLQAEAVDCTSTSTLSNGVPLSGVGQEAGAWSCTYKLTVPTGATRVEFTTSGGTGDGDLYVRRGSTPTEAANDCKSASGSNSETCALTVTSSGTYYARMYGYSTFSGATITGTYTLTTGQPGCTSTSPISNGSTTYGLSAAPGTFSCDYTLEVPSGATSLTFYTYLGSGGMAHLYAKRGSAPTLSSYDCKATTGGGNNQTCTVTSPAAGTWHVRLYNADSSMTLTGAALHGSYVTGGTGNPGTGTLTNGVAVTGLSGAQGSYRYWTITVPAGRTSLLVQTYFGTGDSDLYVRQGSQPTEYTYTCSSAGTGATESCLINAPTAGVYHVMIKGYSDYSGLTLKASY